MRSLRERIEPLPLTLALLPLLALFVAVGYSPEPHDSYSDVARSVEPGTTEPGLYRPAEVATSEGVVSGEESDSSEAPEGEAPEGDAPDPGEVTAGEEPAPTGSTEPIPTSAPADGSGQESQPAPGTGQSTP